MALFPWNYHSLESLWSGAMNQPGTRAGWQLMIDRWLGAVVVGGNDALAVVSTMDSSCGFCLQIPTDAPAVRTFRLSLLVLTFPNSRAISVL